MLVIFLVCAIELFHYITPGCIILMLVTMPQRRLAKDFQAELDTLMIRRTKCFQKKLRRCHERYRPVTMKGSFDEYKQDYKRKYVNMLHEDADEWEEEERNAMVEHGRLVVEAGWDDVQDMLTRGSFDDQRFAVHAFRASRNATDRSAPTIVYPTPNYSQLLQRHGCIQLVGGQVGGRKPGAEVHEEEFSPAEKVPCYNWTTWWLMIGKWPVSMLGGVASSRTFFIMCYNMY